MKKEIKFRGWDGTEMMYPDEVPEVPFPSVRQGYIFAVCDILTEFIGIQDIDEKDIYDGDIVVERSKYGKTTVVVSWRQEMCEYNIGGYAVSYKIIGNIYENPELIKR